MKERRGKILGARESLGDLLDKDEIYNKTRICHIRGYTLSQTHSDLERYGDFLAK